MLFLGEILVFLGIPLGKKPTRGRAKNSPKINKRKGQPIKARWQTNQGHHTKQSKKANNKTKKPQQNKSKAKKTQTMSQSKEKGNQ
jgi:hypothetical protein